MPPKRYTRNCEVIDACVFPDAMGRIAMGIEYNGSLFHGFQSQKSAVATVQQALEGVLGTICDEPITLVCAGRTDRGVHATNQVIHFDTLAKRPERAWLRGANSRLPDGVSIRWAQPVEPQFHARFSAQSRTYRYILYNTPTPSALLHNTLTWDRRRLDVTAMAAAAPCLLGEHDFSAFRGADCQARSPIRTLRRIDIQHRGDFIVIEVQANAFLYHMVRNIVGVLVAIAAGERPVDWAAEVLSSRDRRCAGVTAPAAGLYLVAIDYPATFALPQRNKGPYFL
ncbi:MAG: tRNA pseudouridine(38-40) synthase TruA [Cellvibrionaceae bacterium]|nr:tRNA pseudouridine(38-40) synthase TruA [Cellvibrionaceae bacterium]